MRQLVIDKIISGLTERGLDELGLCYLNHARKREGKPEILSIKIEYDYDLTLDEIKVIIESLSDEELLFVLESQACQQFR